MTFWRRLWHDLWWFYYWPRDLERFLKDRQRQALQPLLATDRPELYEVAKRVCHEYGLPWTDPRTGITHHAPEVKPNGNV